MLKNIYLLEKNNLNPHKTVDFLTLLSNRQKLFHIICSFQHVSFSCLSTSHWVCEKVYNMFFRIPHPYFFISTRIASMKNLKKSLSCLHFSLFPHFHTLLRKLLLLNFYFLFFYIYFIFKNRKGIL
jgi:hypothetical protein